MAEYLIPYSARGTLIPLVEDDEVPDWRENRPFRATVSIDWIEPGASSKRVVILREVMGEKRSFPMLLEDLIQLIQTSSINHGVVQALFKVKRNGRKNFTYTLVKVGD